VARLVVEASELIVRLSRLEKVLALRGDVAVPLSAVEDVSVVDRPWDSKVENQLRLGFATGGAPAQKLMMFLAKAKLRAGGRAVVIVYLNKTSVLVKLAQNVTPYRLILVSTAMAEDVASAISRAAKEVE